MAEFVIRVGGRSAQGRRPNNEDRFIAEPGGHVFLVADGMGGQEGGEKASGMAADIIPRVIEDRLAAHDDPGHAVQEALAMANQAIIDAGHKQVGSRKMGTTAVLAVQQDNQVYVAGLGDSRAYLIRGDRVDQLTVDHTVADALARNGTLTPDQAKSSPWRNVLYKFLGCAEMSEGAEGQAFTPQAGDRLVLGSDGLTNFVTDADLREGASQNRNPQEWADYLVEAALGRGSKDNVTCVVVAFDPE
ncbi:MAG TPA: protein phosphatase 2C domain-containing protein [Gemmataceae bacterium]|nr:protein phosphatase 2C domain-containing protein [Gemmataceae bacterium]